MVFNIIMKKITTLQEKDVYPEKSVSEETQYSERITGKAIILDNEGKIGLVGNKQNDFLQLPGGGIDTDEDIKVGIIRECLEETGCVVTIQNEVGLIDDYRPRDKKHCINYCYIVRVSGKKGEAQHTDGEKEIGMYTKWVTPQEALEIFQKQKAELEAGKVIFYNTGFNILRDFLFLEEANLSDLIHE